MDRDEIINTMSKPRSAALVPLYRQIYLMAAKKPFRGCLCGNGFDNLWRTCKGYADVLQQQKITENKLKEDAK